ncbi:hypothetical protein BH23GEM4_BH23GEM4_10760 [soil metagenome]
MVIDTSALIALLEEEATFERIERALSAADKTPLPPAPSPARGEGEK